MTERCGRIEINASTHWIQTVVFLADGKYLAGGGFEGVRVWRVEDGEQIAAMPEPKAVYCFAVSDDGKWLAAGTGYGYVCMWNAETYEQVLKHRQDYKDIHAVDFSRDSAQLVAASFNVASVWDIVLAKQVLQLRHDNKVTAARYSPQGDRIATATEDSVRVYDSNDGRLLVVINVAVKSWFNKGLLWYNDHLVVVSDGEIKEFDATTGSVILGWPVPVSDFFSCISLPNDKNLVAYSSKRAITFWDMSTHSQLGLVHHPQDIRSITLSPDDQFIAVGGGDGKIIIQGLSHIRVKVSGREQDGWPSAPGGLSDSDSDGLSKPSSLPRSINIFLSSPLDPGFYAPDSQISATSLDLWEQDQLMDADALLTTAIATCQNTCHHTLTSRALVRARLREWNTALVDAEESIEIQPSVLGYIAKSVALVGMGETRGGLRTCDIAFACCHSSHVTFLLLIKAIIVFTSGEHLDAISRVDDLIATVTSNSICYATQAYMYLLLGNSQMERGDYEGAIESFERARTKVRQNQDRLSLVISLIFGWKFEYIDVTIRQRLCDALYGAGRTKDAVECFREMSSDLSKEAGLRGDNLQWALNFRRRASEELVSLGDTAVEALQLDMAIFYYTTALSLDPPSPPNVFIKRGKAFLANGSWKQAVDDANQAIKLDASSPWGYEMKHTALHMAGEYDDAVDAFEAMLSQMALSHDPVIQQYGDQYIKPSFTRATIRRTVQRTLRHSPRVLISTASGRLHDRADLALEFESLPIFKELVSSMTKRIDYVRIKREVREYFRYVMLSHKWEDNEPLFQQVMRIAVYDLDKSPSHDKLQTFCKIVRDGGFNWAWSDTCCINKSDNFVLQEALVAMFKWYQCSAMVIVFLRGVRSTSQLGALVKSVWNTRAWTLQEYVAAKAIQFYTEDWTLYLNLELPNHKESQEVISEMERATGISAEQLMSLRPGLTSIREKLRLAATRQTTLVEDTAYSLLGIFSVTGIPAIYGEGEASLGRLLAHVLTGSGDVGILAWTGEFGNFNSCLPAQITVFSGPATSHLPPPIPDVETEGITTTSFDLDLALNLYDRLNELPAPWFAASRMKLPCIAFQLPPLSSYRTRSGRLYRTDTLAFGMVEIATKYDLSRMKSLYLVHPWLDALLEQEGGGIFVQDDGTSPPSTSTDGAEFSDEEPSNDDCSSPSESEPELLSHSVTKLVVPMDRETQARRFVARLRQPFGALLLTPVSSSRRGTDYRRVATDSLITVRFQENVSLADILGNVRTLDVL